MSSFGTRLLDTVQRFELVPAELRHRLLRAMGIVLGDGAFVHSGCTFVDPIGTGGARRSAGTASSTGSA